MFNTFLRFCFKLSGWKIIGEIPKELRKASFAVCPHNTWKDFLIGIASRAVINRYITYLGKAELFRPPIGFFFRGLGGTPVQRFKNMNMVESYSKFINDQDDLLFAVAPEGTRKNVSKLRTGFYYMSVNANIPIIPVGFDFPKKQMIFAEPFMPTGNFEADMQKYFVPFFKQIGGFQKDWIREYEKGNFEG